jgi:N-acetylgalactosamine kinase
VLEFRKVCASEEDDLMKIEECEVLARLGELMNGSHSSLRDLYECSHPQLDTLVHLSQSVCHGARLTGAG